MSTQAFVALGSNLDNPIEQVRKAISYLNNMDQCDVVSSSSLYISQPQGPQDQEDYVNAVVKISTALDPFQLLDSLKELEETFGRVKTRHWGERIIDLDIIFYGEDVITSSDPDLQIPHTRATQREFVLRPLLEIDPKFVHPNGTNLCDYLASCESFNLRVIDENK